MFKGPGIDYQEHLRHCGNAPKFVKMIIFASYCKYQP